MKVDSRAVGIGFRLVTAWELQQKVSFSEKLSLILKAGTCVWVGEISIVIELGLRKNQGVLESVS